jgi:cell division protein FtsQ
VKRPEGFDPRRPGSETRPAAGAREPVRPARKKPQQAKAAKPGQQGSGQQRSGPKGSDQNRPERKKPERKKQKSRVADASAAVPSGAARAEARKAARARKRYERGEVRRFTRRSRNRRAAWLTVLGVFALLFGLVAVAVYSPALALKTVRVEGASTVSAAEVKNAVKGQLGTPLALLDLQRIKTELAKFPLIRSYVTEAVPPNTLIIHIVERSPIGALSDASGFVVVDPAGVTISRSEERPEGLPIIDTGSADTRSVAFRSAVSVLLALPSSVLSTVDTVTATTNDDVTLVLSGVGQKVVWGSADRSAMKARVLADLIAHEDPGAAVEFDVSAPNNAVVRPG